MDKANGTQRAAPFSMGGPVSSTHFHAGPVSVVRRPATVVARLEAVEGSAALLTRLEPELERVQAAEAIASGTPP